MKPSLSEQPLICAVLLWLSLEPLTHGFVSLLRLEHHIQSAGTGRNGSWACCNLRKADHHCYKRIPEPAVSRKNLRAFCFNKHLLSHYPLPLSLTFSAQALRTLRMSRTKAILPAHPFTLKLILLLPRAGKSNSLPVKTLKLTPHSFLCRTQLPNKLYFNWTSCPRFSITPARLQQPVSSSTLSIHLEPASHAATFKRLTC